ncbi:galactolipase DONGLE, chloroplastic [Malania oleifera]|uniref:galactolipase DONGLE, chloroplastic n=1 Tax=Malania oleifera TaxID=397392 RepID=UPI0025AE2E8F|nr:galactolipase DONGLE, chloroplastic [Malania oleifera]
MASTANMTSTTVNLVSVSENSFPRQCSLWEQVSLPKKKSKLSLARQSVVASSIIAPEKTTPAVFSTQEVKTKPRVNLARVWRELQGSNNWEDLVEPLHPLLRNEIIRYGEFVSACYKAFDLDPSSKRYLNCKYGKKNMLREVGMADSGYEITKYIYATADISSSIPIQNYLAANCCGRWIGYIAASSDNEARRLGRRDILITFRGTVTNPEWIANLMSSLTPARLDPHDPRPEIKVESGFLGLYTSDESNSKFGLESCREQLLSEVSQLINKFKGEELSITVAGHSMGSSLGLLFAYDVAELGLNRNTLDREIPITVFSFAGPRVGNSGFKRRCEELGVKVLRIVNVNDPITKMPGVVFNENFRVLGGRYEFPWSCSCYAHVGVELALDFFMMQNPSCVHDLETYINLLKCPKPVQFQRDTGIDFLSKARELLQSAQNFKPSPWITVASSMMNLVQSQRT